MLTLIPVAGTIRARARCCVISFGARGRMARRRYARQAFHNLTCTIFELTCIQPYADCGLHAFTKCQVCLLAEALVAKP
jgi:hypothetical protein